MGTTFYVLSMLCSFSSSRSLEKVSAATDDPTVYELMVTVGRPRQTLFCPNPNCLYTVNQVANTRILARHFPVRNILTMTWSLSTNVINVIYLLILTEDLNISGTLGLCFHPQQLHFRFWECESVDPNPPPPHLQPLASPTSSADPVTPTTIPTTPVFQLPTTPVFQLPPTQLFKPSDVVVPSQSTPELLSPMNSCSFSSDIPADVKVPA